MVFDSSTPHDTIKRIRRDDDNDSIYYNVYSEIYIYILYITYKQQRPYTYNILLNEYLLLV